MERNWREVSLQSVVPGSEISGEPRMMHNEGARLDGRIKTYNLPVITRLDPLGLEVSGRMAKES